VRLVNLTQPSARLRARVRALVLPTFIRLRRPRWIWCTAACHGGIAEDPSFMALSRSLVLTFDGTDTGPRGVSRRTWPVI